MSTLKEFTQSTARPLPVILLADTSSSMSVDGKIQALNQSVREMIETFSEAGELRAEIHVAVVTFGGTAQLHVPMQPSGKIEWQNMQADGMTPMGQAMKIAKEMIEDKDQVPSRSYRPTVVLISDGMPNDEGWEQTMNSLTTDGRSAKADRLALAVGADADEAMLKRFLADPEKSVFHAEDASKIRSFFKFVTMSVSSRSRSSNPNVVPPQGLISIEEF